MTTRWEYIMKANNGIIIYMKDDIKYKYREHVLTWNSRTGLSDNFKEFSFGRYCRKFRRQVNTSVTIDII